MSVHVAEAAEVDGHIVTGDRELLQRVNEIVAGTPVQPSFDANRQAGAIPFCLQPKHQVIGAGMLTGRHGFEYPGRR